MHLKVGKSFLRLTNTFWLNEPSFQFYPNPSSDAPENSRSLCRDCCMFQLDILWRNYVVYKEKLISFYAVVVNRTLTPFIFLNGKLLNLYQFVPKVY